MVNMTDRRGFTPLTMALGKGHDKVEELLIEKVQNNRKGIKLALGATIARCIM